ncbi:sororin [Genypterus blacodes]|uniref:sororin n=1 Tax=Genypterus blacodes TaxID=154954 RepID=UPI003F76D406
MNEIAPIAVMGESNVVNGSQRRRSSRLSSPQTNLKTDDKMAQVGVAVKRRITVRKIAPRKTTAPSEHNKENTPRVSEGSQGNKTKVSTPGSITERKRSSPRLKAALPSPILACPSTPPPPSQPVAAPGDAVWSKKVRRSYSRLSDQSFHSPDSRDNMFGFDQLKTPEVKRRVDKPKTGLEVSVSGSFSGLGSFTSLLEADDGGSADVFPEPDPNIPGVAVVKERKRRKKVQQIGNVELDALAASMNAEFDEAEGFELVVE